MHHSFQFSANVVLQFFFTINATQQSNYNLWRTLWGPKLFSPSFTFTSVSVNNISFVGVHQGKLSDLQWEHLNPRACPVSGRSWPAHSFRTDGM
jgi:hypothetical protein